MPRSQPSRGCRPTLRKFIIMCPPREEVVAATATQISSFIIATLPQQVCFEASVAPLQAQSPDRSPACLYNEWLAKLTRMWSSSDGYTPSSVYWARPSDSRPPNPPGSRRVTGLRRPTQQLTELPRQCGLKAFAARADSPVGIHTSATWLRE